MATESNELPKPQGHTIGFIDNQSACDSFVQALLHAGLAESKIMVLHGPEGIRQWEQMMEGSLWGESAEEMFKNGIAELEAGHYVVSIEVQDSVEASHVAELSDRLGGHSFYHFGFLTDTRLTA